MHTATSAPRTTLRSLLARDPIVLVPALAFAVLAALLPIAILLDDRTIAHQSVWIKPHKFAISLTILLVTCAWLLPKHTFSARVAHGLRIAIALSCVLEFALIFFQAARGVPSHFNFSSRFDGGIYAAMGFLVAIMTLVLLIMACTPLKPASAGGPASPGLRAGIRAGYVLILLGCAWGAFMAARPGNSIAPHGMPLDAIIGLPYVAWSTTQGDTRPAHFLLLHGFQLMPLLGFALDRARIRRPALVVWLVASCCATAGLVLIALALQGRPFVP